MRDRRAPERPSRRAAVALGRRARTHLHRLVARGTAALAIPAGLAAIAIGAPAADPILFSVGVGAAAIGAIAVLQLRRGRPDAVTLNLLSAVLVGIASVHLPHEVAAGLGASVLVFMFTGLPLLHGRRAAAYLLVMLACWAAHPLSRHLLGGGDRTFLTANLIQLAILAFGLLIVGGLREQFTLSESRYSYLFSHAPVALWENDFSRAIRGLDELADSGVTDLRRHFEDQPDELRRLIGLVETVDANPEAGNLLGADPQQLAGSFGPEILDAESERLFREQFVAIWEGRQGGDLEYTGRRFDGSTFHGMLRWVNPTLGDGDPSRVVTAVSDLSGLRAVEQELASTEITARALFDAIPDLLFLCDADGTYRDYHVADSSGIGGTSSTVDDFYVPPSEFLGKQPREVLPADIAEQIQIAITTALETDHVQTLEYDLAVGGRERAWEMRVSPLTGRSQVVTLVRDITDRVRARRELERLVRSKDDFINAISHELRTPLTGIVGFTQLLMSDDPQASPDDRRQMIETLADQSADLSDIVEDLLVAAKADLGRLRIASVPVDLRAQVNQVVEGWDPKALGGVRLEGGSSICLGDPSRVRQIVRNLLTNAVRYGGDEVRVTVESGPVTGRVIVSDDGPGIPPDEVEDAFRPYHRAAARDGLTAALGIGLPISRTLARMMGGDLLYRRVEGESCFELILPAAERQPSADAPIPDTLLETEDAGLPGGIGLGR
jgi:signal transduction histidine kinase